MFLRQILPSVLFGLMGTAAFADTPYFSAIPDEDASALVARFTKVADYLEAQLGVDVEFVPVKSYPAAVTAFTNDQVQLAWFGGLTSVQARLANPGAQSIAQGKEDPTFISYLIANTSTASPKKNRRTRARGSIMARSSAARRGFFVAAAPWQWPATS